MTTLSPAAGLSVTAAMIVRNEEKHLGPCLETLRGQVDEIVIVDTGSTDDTMEIARAYGARVFTRPWDADFAAARNAALDHASGEWILYLDADERLRVPHGRVADHLIAGAAACSVRFRPRTGFTRYREWRLFPRRADIRFSGTFHETMLPAVRALSERAHMPMVATGIAIDHLGYDGDQSHKHARNLPMLRAALLQTPARVYVAQHLAETLAATGAWDEAEVVAAQSITATPPEGPDEHRAALSLLRQFLARALLRRGADARQIIEDGLRHVPEDYALHYLLAQVSLAEGDATGCLSLAEQLTAIDPEDLDGVLAFDASIFGIHADRLKAAAYMRLGRLDRAAQLLRQHAKSPPG